MLNYNVYSLHACIQNVKQFYYDAEPGPTVDDLVFQHEVVEINKPQVLGWTVLYEHLNVSI